MALSSNRDIYSATIGGYGRQFENEILGSSRGGHTNLAICTWCQPDTLPNPQIIALCGITDHTRRPSFNQTPPQAMKAGEVVSMVEG